MTRQSMCIQCKFYKNTNKCKAFPNGIPIEISQGYKYHIDKVKGDKGIQFKKIGLAEDHPFNDKKKLKGWADAVYGLRDLKNKDKEIIY